MTDEATKTVDTADDLKVNKITRDPNDPARGRTFLPMMPTAGPDDEPVTEAYGGRGETAEGEPLGDDAKEAMHERIVERLKSIYDPEIPVNIYDLGLIYGFEIADDGAVEISMTLTAPGCPVAGMLVKQVADEVGEVEGVRVSHVALTWDPPWSRDRMSEEAMLELGLL